MILYMYSGWCNIILWSNGNAVGNAMRKQMSDWSKDHDSVDMRMGCASRKASAMIKKSKR